MVQESKKRLGRPTKAPTPGKRVSLGLKVTAEIKQRIDEEACRTGRTQSQQAELMIERSFSEQAALGGPEMQRLAYHMISLFALPAQRSARDKQNWVSDPDGYRAGVIGVCDGLFQGLSDDDAALVIESLKGRLLSRIVHREQEQDK
jgi:hypothetical protein